MSASWVGTSNKGGADAHTPFLNFFKNGSDVLRPLEGGKATGSRLPDPFALTDRRGRDLFEFIWQHLDDSEKKQFFEDITIACSSESIETFARLLADWEATAEVNSNPEFASELLGAAEASRARRRGNHA